MEVYLACINGNGHVFYSKGHQISLRMIGATGYLPTQPRHRGADIPGQFDDSTCHPAAGSFSTAAGTPDHFDFVIIKYCRREGLLDHFRSKFLITES